MLRQTPIVVNWPKGQSPRHRHDPLTFIAPTDADMKCYIGGGYYGPGCS